MRRKKGPGPWGPRETIPEEESVLARWMERLEQHVERRKGYGVVSWELCREVALAEGVPRRRVEIELLRRGIVPSRYERNVGTLGCEGQLRLLESRAAVVGCGGLGGLVVELLARGGVGHLVLVDGDTFADHNLNRQILCREEDLGRPKARVAAERVKAVNGAVDTTAVEDFLTDANSPRILTGCDVAVDALDSQSARRVLFGACAALGIPAVHGAIGGFWGQVGTVLPGDRSVLNLWDAEGPERGVEVETGNPPFTPAVVAALEVAEALKLLAGVGSLLRGRLLWGDLGLQNWQSFSLE